MATATEKKLAPISFYDLTGTNPNDSEETLMKQLYSQYHTSLWTSFEPLKFALVVLSKTGLRQQYDVHLKKWMETHEDNPADPHAQMVDFYQSDPILTTHVSNVTLGQLHLIDTAYPCLGPSVNQPSSPFRHSPIGFQSPQLTPQKLILTADSQTSSTALQSASPIQSSLGTATHPVETIVIDSGPNTQEGATPHSQIQREPARKNVTRHHPTFGHVSVYPDLYFFYHPKNAIHSDHQHVRFWYGDKVWNCKTKTLLMTRELPDDVIKRVRDKGFEDVDKLIGHPPQTTADHPNGIGKDRQRKDSKSGSGGKGKDKQSPVHSSTHPPKTRFQTSSHLKSPPMALAGFHSSPLAFGQGQMLMASQLPHNPYPMNPFGQQMGPLHSNSPRNQLTPLESQAFRQFCDMNGYQVALFQDPRSTPYWTGFTAFRTLVETIIATVRTHDAQNHPPV